VQCTVKSCRGLLAVKEDTEHLWCPRCRWEYMGLPSSLAIAEWSGMTGEDLWKASRSFGTHDWRLGIEPRSGGR